MDEKAWQDLFLLYVIVLGACIGSFLNVVIARVPIGESVVKPRSKCPKCEASIAWYDNIPIISYLALLARCRNCKVHIPVRYPLVEVLMAALAGAIWVKFGYSWNFAIWLPLSSALVAISFIDIDHFLIPDIIVFPMICFVGAAVLLPGGITPLGAVVGLLPALLIYGVGWGFERLTGQEGLGFGDVKLLALLGMAMGLQPALNILLLASIQGAIIGMILRVFSSDAEQEGVTPTEVEEGTGEEEEWVPPPHAIPFGPFLVLGAFQVLLLPGDLANLAKHLNELIGNQLM